MRRKGTVWLAAAVLAVSGFAPSSFAASVAPSCPAGHSYDAATKHCVSVQEAGCANARCAYYDPKKNVNYCSLKFPPITACMQYFSPNRPDKLNGAPICPAGHALDGLTHKCVSSKDPLCPSGYKFVPANNKCETQAGKAQ